MEFNGKLSICLSAGLDHKPGLKISKTGMHGQMLLFQLRRTGHFKMCYE